jgi:hypothetical protein
MTEQLIAHHAWTRVEHPMFEQVYAKKMTWLTAMTSFLYTDPQGWMDRTHGTKLMLPDEERPDYEESRKCHCYYYGGGTAGVVEFRRVWRDNIGWEPNVFEWRVVNERQGPSAEYRGLFIHILHELWTPAPNNEAARWRWQNWHARGLQVPIYRGMGAFSYNGRDRYPYIVAKRPESRLKGIELAHVAYKVVSGSAQDGSAKYEFDTTINDRETLYVLPSNRKGEKGQHVWRFPGGGSEFIIGFFDAYRDPHF